MAVKRALKTAPYYRAYNAGSGQGGAGAVTHTVTCAPLSTTQRLLMIGNSSNNSASGAYSSALSGWTWSTAPDRIGVNDNYPANFFDIGKRNAAAAGTSYTIYCEANWSNFSIWEFPGLKGEIVDCEDSWNSGVNTLTLTLKNPVPERNLLAIAIFGQDAGGNGPDSMNQLTPTSGWTAAYVTYNFVVCWLLDPAVGSLPSVKVNCSSRTSNWVGAIYLLR